MSSNCAIVSRGYLLPGGALVSETEIGQARMRAGRWAEFGQFRTSGVSVVTADTDLSKHAQVQTIPTTDVPTGAPPSAPKRRT
jgi:hypothetical protein